jgi:phenylacetic acid degradation operon negative regulatory protein
VKLTAQKLVLDLASAAMDQHISAKAVVLVARLFHITENNIRVELARLLAKGLLERAERGRYRLAKDAWAVHRHVASWSQLEERVVPWAGGWAGVYLSRSAEVTRAGIRHRRRALGFLGLKELDLGLWVRPDNLAGGVPMLRARLYELGLDERSRVFAIKEMDPQSEAQSRGLWNPRELEESYNSMTTRLQESGALLQKQPLEQAVVESFLVGGQAINLLAYDPLLPEEIFPPKKRQQLVKTMRCYDRQGRECWQSFADQNDIPEIVLPSDRPGDAISIKPQRW